MKNLAMFVSVLFWVSSVFAQTYLDVPGGYGTLNDSIAVHKGSVIYRLQAGQWYGLNGIIENNGFPLTIVGTTPLPGQMPAEIQTGTNPDGTVLTEMFNMVGDLTLKNLFIVNANSYDAFGQYVFWGSSPTSIRLVIDSCVFDPAGHEVVDWTLVPRPRLFMTNSQVINLGDLNSEWTGNFIETNNLPHNGLDTLYLENNTFLSTGMLLLFNGSFMADSGGFYWVNHNSFIFHKFQFIWQWHINDYFVTNNMFFDFDTSPTTFASNVNFPDGTPTSRFALVNDDTVSSDSSSGRLLSSRKLFVQYNSDYTDPRFEAYATTWPATHTVNNDGKTPIPASYLVHLMYPSDSGGVNREAHMCGSPEFPYFKEGNYWDNLMGAKPNTDPGFTDPRFYAVQDSLVKWTLPTIELAQWGFDPTLVKPQPSQAGDWFWHADTSFGNPTTWPRVNATYTNPMLLTASIEGLPLGDLNWFPSQKKIWEANKSVVMQHILDENTSRLYLVPSQPTGIEWNFANGLDGWGGINGMIYSHSTVDSAAVFTITGQYPFFLSPDHLNINASSFASITFVIKNNTNDTTADFYWITDADSIYSEGQTTSSIPITTGDTAFKEYTVPLSHAPGWGGTIRQIRFDPSNHATSGTVEVRLIRLNPVGTVIDQESPDIPKEFSLSQNYPNPFNPTTQIDYSIPKKGYVSLKVYNVLGQEVATLFSGVVNPGNYNVTFDATHLSSGVYFYRLQAGDVSITKKLVLLK